MKVCPKCHAINDDDANFCKICGYRFPEEKTIRVPPPELTRKVKEIKTTLEEPITQPPTTQTPATFTPPQPPSEKVSPPPPPQQSQSSPAESVQQNNIIRQKVIQKERRVIRTVTIIAIVVTVLLLIPLALNGVSIHYIPKGVTALTTQELDSVLGGNWIIPTNISTNETASYVYTYILHTKDNLNVKSYYKYFGYKVYDLVEVYLQFPNETLAKQFYLNYTKGVITTSINTYPATVFNSSTAIAVTTQFGNYFIYIEVYSANGSAIPYTTTQIIQLIKNMEVT